MKRDVYKRQSLERLKYDNKTIEDVTTLVGAHMTRFARLRDANLKKLISQVGKDNLTDLYDLQKEMCIRDSYT